MSKFSLDLSKFKKTSTDKGSSVLRHEDGHELKIDHKKLPKALLSKLDKLPMADKVAEKPKHYDEGGEVTFDPEKLPDVDVNKFNEKQKTEEPKKEESFTSAMTPTLGPTTEEMAQMSAPAPSRQIDYAASMPPQEASMPEQASAPQMEAPVQAQVPVQGPAPQPQASQIGLGDVYQQQLAGVEKQQQGAVGQELAKGQMGAAQVKHEQQYQGQVNQAMRVYEGTMKDLLQQDAMYQQDLANRHIDPNKYINNMSTGAKITTGIGLILGGMGAGLTGSPNLAFQHLQSQIDRDIDSQKAEIGKEENLLAHNTQLMGNARAGLELTRLQLGDIVNSQIRMEAQKAATPMALAAAQQQEGLWMGEKAKIMHDIAINNMRNSTATGADPAKLVPYLVPKEHQAKAFAEIEAAENTRKMSTEIMKQFEDAAKANTIARTGAGLLRTPPSVGALHQALQPTFKDLEGTVRQAAMDNTFKNVTPAPGDFADTIQTKREALQEYLKSKLSAPTARGYGIDLGKFQSTAPQEAAPEVKTMNGVKYQKVTGGWKKVQ